MRGPYRPGYFLLPSPEPQRSRPPARSQGWYGWLRLRGVCEQPVHVGSGAPERVHLQGRSVLIEGMSTLPSDGGPVPVIPGSSWKGAVRSIVEALTPSCERPGDRGCHRPEELCPACALLGAPGWRATVMFSDLRSPPGIVPIPLSIAQRYSHTSAPRQGRRLYRCQPEEPQPRDREMLMVFPKGTQLEGAITMGGATDEGLGLITLALGLGPLGLPCLRIGGGKNRRLGFVRFDLAAAHGGQGLAALDSTRSIDLSGRVGEWQQAAVRRFPSLEERLELIRTHYIDE